MKDKKGIIKKIKKGLKIAIASTLISATLMTGAVAVHKNIQLNDYATTSQIEFMAEELDCDTSYMSRYNNRFIQMEHNGEEPIYVCFDESLNQAEIESAKKSLDEIFGIVGKINSNYKYKIVSKDVYKSKINRTKIYYNLGKYKVADVDVNGYIDREINLVSRLTNKRTYNNYEINFNRDKFTTNQARDYTFKHELFHAFGVDDVYIIENDVIKRPKLTKSLIDATNADGNSMLTPNDVKCLVSLYQEKQETPEKQKKYIKDMKAFIKDYEENFYLKFSQNCKQKTNLNFSFQQSKVDAVSSLGIYLEDESRIYYNYNVSVDGTTYKFSITNEKGNMLDSCNGEVLWVNDIAVLKDVKLKAGLWPGYSESFKDFLQDLVLIKTSEDQVSLYHYASNDLMFTKTLYLSENNVEQSI